MSFGFGFSLPTLGWHLSGGGASSGYSVTKSLRFRSSASAYLNRTFAAGNQKTWTWSGWVKRGQLGITATLFGQGTGSLSSGYAFIRYETNDDISFVSSADGNTASGYWQSTALYRDPAAWYHVVVVLDTTQATAANRLVFYINGAIVSGTFSTTPGLNANIELNRAAAHQIGASNANGLNNYHDGEMAEVYFVDGQALAPTAFGAFSTYNQWLPIAYAGTYGTNGFYLPFNSVSTSSYAGSFNGSNQYLSMPLNAVLTLGSGNFTVEAWILKSTSGAGEVFGKTGTINYAIDCATISGNYTNITLSSDGVTTTNISGGTALATNRWYHVAWVRSGTTINIYVNGVLDGTGTFSGAIYSGSNVDVSGIGARPGSGTIPDTWFNGSISNLRVVKGTAVYTANFTPSVVPLTAITNTSLLTLQSATIVDNSGNSVSITNNNTVVTSVQYPFTLAIAADSSGNANNWTPNNISLTAGSTYDSLTDVPTLTSETVANYAVLNPTANPQSATISSANLAVTAYAASGIGPSSTIGVSSGKWYFEFTPTVTIGASGGLGVGIINKAWLSSGNWFDVGQQAYFYYFNSSNTATKYFNGTSTSLGAYYLSPGDIGAIAFDLDTLNIYLYKNNVQVGTGTLPSGQTWFASSGNGSSGAQTYGAYYNFGQQPFVYPTLPTGFLPLNTFNI